MMMRDRLAGAAIAAAAALGLATGAAAQSTFHVKEFDYEQGKWIFETINAVQGRFPERADRIRAGHELGLAYAVTSWWLPKLLVSFEKPADEDYSVQRVFMENTFALRPLVENRDGIGLAWFQSIEAAVHRDATNATIFGPIVTGQVGKFSATINPFWEKTFGQNREPGMNFIWAWQARYEVMDKVKIGVEGYGVVPEVGARTAESGGVQHRIGPVLILETDLGHGGGNGTAGRTGMRHAGNGHGNGAHAEIEMGVLFGTTDATADVTGKINMHLKF